MELDKPVTDPSIHRQSLGLSVLIIAQVFATVFFLSDTVVDFIENGSVSVDLHLIVETVAGLTLAASVVFEFRYLIGLLRRQARMERSLSVASGALHDLMENNFREWGLTPSEQDVATFAIKGMSIADIATIRGSAEGTVKAHLNGIYRKAGVSGRHELVSLLIEDLMDQPLLDEDGQRAAE